MQESEYERDSECEDYADYGPDGYHPVALGQKFNHSYIVVQKLGWGHFSTVWLVQHEVSKEYFAIKIQRSKDNHAQSALDQLKLLNEIMKHEKDAPWVEQLSKYEQLHPEHVNAKLCRPLLLIDNFPHHGIHGKHYCSVFEILGPNLLDVIQHYEFNDERMPLWLVKKITIDVLLGLVYLHEHCDIIHTDLKPENIMIKLETDEEAQLIENIKKYKIKPISMKYLKALQTSKNAKTKKKNQKKRLKKKQQQQEGDKEEGDKEEGDKEEGNKEEEDSVISKPVSSQQSTAKKQQTEKSEQIHQQQIDKKIVGVKEVVKEEIEVIDVGDVIGDVKGEEEKQENLREQVEETVRKGDGRKKKEGEEGGKKMEGEEVNMGILKWKNVEIELNRKLFFKIVDMGNACFSTHHFTEDVQTREYRAPEVILGYSYDHSADMWSLACTVFEMMTNNFLFKPKRIQGISKNEDHLYKIIEVLGPISKQFLLNGKNSDKYFNKKGRLLHGHPKEHIRIHQILHEDYDYSLQDAVEIEQFLLPMLELQDEKRISAKECLQQEWLWK